MVAGRRTFHVMAAVGAFNGDTTLAAILPAVLLDDLEKSCRFGILGTFFLVGVIFVVAFRTDFSVALWTFTVDLLALFVELDVLRFDPQPAALAGTVKSAFGGPFFVLGVPELSKVALIQMCCYLGLYWFPIAALGRHV